MGQDDPKVPKPPPSAEDIAQKTKDETAEARQDNEKAQKGLFREIGKIGTNGNKGDQ